MQKIIFIIIGLFITFLNGNAQTLLCLSTKKQLVEYNIQTGNTRIVNDSYEHDAIVSTDKISIQQPTLLTTTDTLRCKLYKFDDNILSVKYNCMNLCRNGLIVWKKGSIDCKDDCNGIYFPNNYVVYFIPIFSSDYTKLIYVDSDGPMFHINSNIVEIDLSNGEKKSINRKCTNPSYSSGEQYILMRDYRKDTKYYVYDRNKDKIVKVFKCMKDMRWKK